ncbi:MAG: hypothetical protein ACQSGP_22165, partial [Frankia sp.]
RPVASVPVGRPPVAPPSEAKPVRSPSHDRVRAALRDVPWEALAASEDGWSPASLPERLPVAGGPHNPYWPGGGGEPGDPLFAEATGLDDDEIWEPDETDGPELEIDPAELGEAPDHWAYRFRAIDDADIEDAEVEEDGTEFGGLGGDGGFGPVRSLAGELLRPYDVPFSPGLGSPGAVRSGLGSSEPPPFDLDPLGPDPLRPDHSATARFAGGPGEFGSSGFRPGGERRDGTEPLYGREEFADPPRWGGGARFEAGRYETRRYEAARFDTATAGSDPNANSHPTADPEPAAGSGAGATDDREANQLVEPTEPARPVPEKAFAYGPRTPASSRADERPASDPADQPGDPIADETSGWDEPASGDGGREALAGSSPTVDDDLYQLHAPGEPGEAAEPADRPGSAAAVLEAAIAALSDRVDELVRLRRHDAELVDKLHAENARLRQGELTEAMAPLLRGLMRLHDQMASIARDDTESVAGLLRNQLLQSLDLAADMRPYTAVRGMPFDPTRHLGVRRVPTDDPGLDRTVARTMKPGFVRGQTTVVRPAEVEVYRAN